MKLIGFPILVLIGVLVCAAYATAQSRVPESDNQSWNDLQITVPMTKKVDFTTQITLRLGDNVTQTADQRWGIGFVFKLNKYLSFTPFYFHREARPPNGRHESEDRLTLGATVRIPAGKFTVSNRSWFERRWREPQVEAWRYRDRLQVEHPFKINKKPFTWFVSGEAFYDWSLHVWPRDRFSGGVSHPFNKHLTLELYYTRQNDSHTRPGDLNIIWSAWRVKL
ncbi:MAG: hypothetical protein QOI77_2306 [Blastocatellia bacterium]|jgi:hypothetical protein|nr:hypothetical protein [Blastocatellia bacterium]